MAKWLRRAGASRAHVRVLVVKRRLVGVINNHPITVAISAIARIGNGRLLSKLGGRPCADGRAVMRLRSVNLFEICQIGGNKIRIDREASWGQRAIESAVISENGRNIIRSMAEFLLHNSA